MKRYRIPSPVPGEAPLLDVGLNDSFTWRGRQYPRNWLGLATPEEIAAAGLVEYTFTPSKPFLERTEFFDKVEDAMIKAGVLTEAAALSTPVDVYLETAIRSTAGLDTKTKRRAINRVRHAQRFYRVDPDYPGLLDQMAQSALGLTIAQVDGIFEV